MWFFAGLESRSVEVFNSTRPAMNSSDSWTVATPRLHTNLFTFPWKLYHAKSLSILSNVSQGMRCKSSDTDQASVLVLPQSTQTATLWLIIPRTQSYLKRHHSYSRAVRTEVHHWHAGVTTKSGVRQR